MLNETHRAPPRYKISDFFSSLLVLQDSVKSAISLVDSSLAPLVSVFDERFNLRLFNDGRFHLFCSVFFCMLAILKNSAGKFAIGINNRQTEIL